jgi:hypothetical protein
MEKYKVIDVSEWEYSSSSKGSKEKMDLIDPKKNKIFMFKEPAENSGDNWSEKIASELGIELGFNVQKVDLAINNGIKGVLIHYSLDIDKGEALTEGVILLKKDNVNFDPEKRDGYTFQAIEKSLLDISEEVFEAFLEIIVFDILIGNTDRHSENWGIIKKINFKNTKLIAAYDNSSSLSRELHSNEEKIKELLSNKPVMFDSYIRRSGSMVGLDGKKRVKHFEMLEFLIEEYSEKLLKYLKILENLSNIKIEKIINMIPNEFMGEYHKVLVKKIIKKRRDLMIEKIEERKLINEK